MKTYSMKLDEIAKDWLIVDAEGAILGRLAAAIAPILMGKNKPICQGRHASGSNWANFLIQQKGGERI